MAKTGQNAKTSRSKVEEYVEYDNFLQMREINAGDKIERMREISLQLDALNAEWDELQAELEPALIVEGQKAVRCGRLLLVQCDGRSPDRISQEMLLAHAVDPEAILASTIPGKAYTYLQVKEEKEG